MKPIVIKKGQVLIKSNGILYETDHESFNEIRTIIFDYDSPLCKRCKDSKCRDNRKIDDDFITEALTLKGKKKCEYVFDCKKFELSKPKDYESSRLVIFSSSIDETEIERTINHYGDAYDANIAHPRVKRNFHKL